MGNIHRYEWHVGLFFNLGLGLMLLVLFLFGGPSFFLSSKLHYHFNEVNAQGLTKGAKVLVAGVTAGTVSEAHVDGRSARVRVDIEVSRKFQSSIRQDSYASLATQGVLGDKVVLIQAGSPGLPELKNDSEISRRSSPSIERLLAEGDTFLQHLDQLTLGINQWVNGLGSGGHSKEIGADVAKTLRNLSKITEHLKNLDTDQLNESLASLESILRKVDQGNGAIGGLVNDAELYDDIKKLIGESNENRIVRNLVRQTIADAEKKKSG